MIASKYQKAIYAFASGAKFFEEKCERTLEWDKPLDEFGEDYLVDFEGRRHAVVEAVAGSGKTTTIVKALEFVSAPMRGDAFAAAMGQETLAPPKVLFVAFNKHIAEELQRRVPKYVNACTLNSLGWGICRQNVPKVEMDVRKDENILRTHFPTGQEESRKIFYKIKGSVGKMVGLLKSLLMVGQVDSFDEIADKYDVNIPEGIDDPNFSFREATLKVLAQSVSTVRYMNFDDQIFMPIHHGWPITPYDWVFGDEAQDWSPVQIELVKRCGGNHGRIIAVGDRHQSIYGFRGADPDAIPNIIASLDAVVLPLSICYRCPDSVIEEAQKIVAHIEKPQDNPKGDGRVETITTQEFKDLANDGDFVLCRTTAPLVKRCLEFIGRGRKAVVKGRDIGANLICVLEDLAPAPSTPVSTFLETLAQYRAEQMEKLAKANREAEMLAVEDRCDTLEVLSMNCKTTLQIRQRIESIFSDKDSDGITFCTIHRSKGLEAMRIFILRPDLIPHPKCKKDWQKTQEDNLLYVAITRSMGELYFILKEKGEK